MDELSQLLSRIKRGDADAPDELFALVYDQLRAMAKARIDREPPGITLQTTALVNELYIRFFGNDRTQQFENRRHFFAAASESMRRILVEAARRRKAIRRGGKMRRLELADEFSAGGREVDPADLLSVHELLDDFASEHARQAEVVKLRFFLGCTFVEIGEILERSDDAVRDDWIFARAWLQRKWSKSFPNSG